MADAGCPDSVIVSIYQNVTCDEPWREAIEHVRVLLHASNLMIRISQKGARQRDAIYAYGPKVEQSKIKDWEDHLYREIFPVNPAMGEVMFFQWEDVLAYNEVLDYLRQYDSSWTIVHCFEATDKIDCLLIGSREREQAPFDQHDGALLKQIGLHFRTAMRLRRDILQLRLTSEFQAEGLKRMAVGGLLVDQNGAMILLNETAKTLVAGQDGIRFVQGRLHATDHQLDRRLQAIIREVLSSEESKPLLRGMAIPRESGKRDLGLVVSGRWSLSLVSGKPEINALIFIRDTESGVTLDIGLMQQLFGFTRAEANLAAGLAKGRSLEELEADLNIRHNTARAHLRSMFLKADVSRQAELVHLLANCVAPLGSADSQDH